LKHYPHGQYAFEPRFRLAEMLQRNGQLLNAAREYDQVSGNSDYEFTARFNSAECYYRALTPQGIQNKPGPLSPAQLTATRAAALRSLRQAIALEPRAE